MCSSCSIGFPFTAVSLQLEDELLQRYLNNLCVLAVLQRSIKPFDENGIVSSAEDDILEYRLGYSAPLYNLILCHTVLVEKFKNAGCDGGLVGFVPLQCTSDNRYRDILAFVAVATCQWFRHA
jgi:hypothetical protein